MKVVLILVLFQLVYSQKVGTAVCDSTSSSIQCQFVPGNIPEGAATGSFEDGLQTTGWGELKLKTSSDVKYPDIIKMYGIGYLEGYFTSQRIYEQVNNLYDLFWQTDDSEVPAIMKWLDEQESWIRARIGGDFNKLANYWQHVALIMAQYDGMIQGFKDNNNQTLKVPITFAFQMLSGWGDILDLIPALNKNKRPDWSKMSPSEMDFQLAKLGHCSALVKIPGDLSDIFMSHSSWFDYGGMNRIFKHYFFDINIGNIGSKKVSFSSYPGALVSIDDFYIMDSNMVMLQTTNGIINMSLYDSISTHALLAWQRVRLANTIATNGKDWCSLIELYNSGTYNNQYMVIDLKRFDPFRGLEDGVLWVAEQIPGQVLYADETEILRYGYWPSYNVPFFPEIWAKSGYGTLGPGNTHSMAPRAQIFRRDQSNVTDINKLKYMMRYNDYLNDPISKGDPGKAICSRFDLEKTGGGAFGCYDTKVTNYQNALKMRSEAINGPTTQNNIPPFAFTGIWSNVTHKGLPTTMNFDFVVMDPNW